VATICVPRHLSCAHLNPAVSIAMVVGRRMVPQTLPPYLLGPVLDGSLASLFFYQFHSGPDTQKNQVGCGCRQKLHPARKVEE